MSNQLNFCFRSWEGHCVHAPSSWTLLILCEHLRNRKCVMLTMIQYGLYMVTQSWIALSSPRSIASQDSFSLSSFKALIFLLESPFSPPNVHMICLLSYGIWVICGQKPYSRILTKVYGLLAFKNLSKYCAMSWYFSQETRYSWVGCQLHLEMVHWELRSDIGQEVFRSILPPWCFSCM